MNIQKRTALFLGLIALFFLAAFQSSGDFPVDLPGSMGVILALISPYIFNFVTQRFQSRRSKFAVAILLSAVSGVVASLAYGYGLQGDSIIEFAYASVALAQTAYGLYWKKFFDDRA